MIRENPRKSAVGGALVGVAPRQRRHAVGDGNRHLYDRRVAEVMLLPAVADEQEVLAVVRVVVQRHHDIDLRIVGLRTLRREQLPLAPRAVQVGGGGVLVVVGVPAGQLRAEPVVQAVLLDDGRRFQAVWVVGGTLAGDVLDDGEVVVGCLLYTSDAADD